MSQLAACLLLAAQADGGLGIAKESDYYAVDYLQPPDGAVLEVGGMDFLPDGRLIASTRRGQVWIVDSPLAKDPKDAKIHLFAEGLQEGLGLKVLDGQIYVIQRSELSRLRDTDHDDVCDTIDTVCNTWGVSGNYHEFAYGLPTDAQGNFYVSLNVGFTDPKWWHGRSLAPYRGWVIQIDKNGNMKPFACGFRSPCGIGTNSAGDLFVTDNQGDWEPVCPLHHVREGRFYGAPASLAWTSAYLETKTEPSLTNPPSREREAAACWIPYKWSRSAGDMRSIPNDGSFGPFGDQMVIAELTNGLVVRADLEKVRGEYQGSTFLMRQKIGSGIRVLFARDGTLFVGMTNRGWGGLSPGHGIARVRWTGKTPFEPQHVHVLQDGFAITLTEPIAKDVIVSPANVELSNYHYDWWWEYGSPVREDGALEVSKVDVSSDRKMLTVHAPKIQAGEMVRGVLKGLRSESGQALLHDEFHYTLNQLPEGAPCTTPIARLVPPPPARESGMEGYLRLTYGDAFDQWKQTGWTQHDVELDPNDSAKLVLKDGVDALVNTGPDATDFTSKFLFGDGRYQMSFTLPKGGAAALLIQGRYEVRIADSASDAPLTIESLGAIAPSAHFPGRAPLLPSYRGAGQSHDLTVLFKAPRFDASGKKTENAVIQRVMVDDVLLHENVVLPEPSTGLPQDEVALAPLSLRAVRGLVAVGDFRVRPTPAPSDAGFTAMYENDILDSFRQTGGATWTSEDGELVSGGEHGYLETEATNWRDIEVQGNFKLNDGGMSSLWLRSKIPDVDPVRGFCVRINATYPHPDRTGSIVNFAPIKVQLVGADTWFRMRARCVDEEKGTRVSVWINDVLVSEVLAPPDVPTEQGGIALEQHGPTTILQVKDWSMRQIAAK